jgi:hypothetical protein
LLSGRNDEVEAIDDAEKFITGELFENGSFRGHDPREACSPIASMIKVE